MTLKKNGLNDSDKIVVTVALWISAVTLFITALTLSMLPHHIMIFNLTGDDTTLEPLSKYNNLFLILVALIPMIIMLVAAALKRHNLLQNNFMSVMLFSIMLSISVSSVVVYGIFQQFHSSSAIDIVNVHGIVNIAIAFVLSLFCSVFPTINHRPKAIEKSATRKGLCARLVENADKFWSVGAYGFLALAVCSAFIPGAFSYIPVSFGIVAEIVFLLVKPHATTQLQQTSHDEVAENN